MGILDGLNIQISKWGIAFNIQGYVKVQIRNIFCLAVHAVGAGCDVLHSESSGESIDTSFLSGREDIFGGL